MSVSRDVICRLAEQASTAASPDEALRLTRALREEIDTFERQQVARALTAGGSVASVARALGVTRQSAHRRFRELIAPRKRDGRPRPTPELRLVVEHARRRHASWPRRRSEASTCSSGSCAQENIRPSRRSTGWAWSTTPPAARRGLYLRRLAATLTSRRSCSRRSKPRAATDAIRLGSTTSCSRRSEIPPAARAPPCRELGVTPDAVLTALADEIAST